MQVVGIIGGGQLGMMLAEQIKILGHKSICLDPNPKCPASFVCDEVVVGKYDDLNALEELGKKCNVITYEFENIKAENLEYLYANYNIKQGIKQLFDSQNRIREKQNALNLGLNTPKFKAVRNYEELIEAVDILKMPCVYKTATLGYDGHGQVVIKTISDLEKVKPYLNQEGIVEEFIDYDFETSIIMVRSKEKIISFPMTRNIHKNGILDLVIADKDMPVFNKIKEDAYQFMIKADYYGILTIEFFVKGDNYYFNEMAPRPHNSGHYTIEGCNTNQYLELAKYLLDIPLSEPKLLHKTIMKNILGYDYNNVEKINFPNAYIHMYHKADVLPFRKMGHITFIDTSLEEYKEKYSKLFCNEEQA